jgi:hypothetical protein
MSERKRQPIVASPSSTLLRSQLPPWVIVLVLGVLVLAIAWRGYQIYRGTAPANPLEIELPDAGSSSAPDN